MRALMLVLSLVPVDVDDAPTISLQALLSFAEEHAPAITAARAGLARADAAQASASVLLPENPQLTVAAGPRVGAAGVGVDIDASLTQELQIAFERDLRIEAAAERRALTEADIQTVRWAIHCEVHALFHRALVEDERVRLALRAVDFQREVASTVEKQVAAGDAAALSLRLAHGELLQAQQSLVAAEQARRAVRLRLAQTAGMTVEPVPRGVLDEPRTPAPLDELRTLAQQALPSLRVAMQRVREAEARAALAEREAWPTPSVGLLYRREGNPSSEGPYDIVMGQLSVPIPSFSPNVSARESARADVSVARAEQQATAQRIDGQMAIARSEVVAAAQRARAYGEEIVPRFEENLTLLSKAFALGELDLLDVLTARERFLRIQQDALSAHADYIAALAALEQVTGVDLWPDDHE